MKVQVHPADEGGCGYYRLRFPVQVLQAQGYDVSIGTSLPCERSNDPWLGDHPVRVRVEADVVVFQRPLAKAIAEIVPILQRQGVAVVVEVDDDFHSLPKGHPARRWSNPASHPDRNWRWLAKACEQADLVTVSTAQLAQRYGAHGRCQVLPNLVPEWYLRAHRRRDPQGRVVIGWPGSTLTHMGDLDVSVEAIRRLEGWADGSLWFRAIGGSRTLLELGVPGEVLPWAPLLSRGPRGYARQVAGLNVGIVPLAANVFNQAKSALKAMEFAALGVPFVYSPTPDNDRVAQRWALGVRAPDAAAWYAGLSLLTSDDGLRDEMATHGREVMQEFTYERQAWRWMEAWAMAAANRSVPV